MPPLVGFMLMIVMGVATWMFPRPVRDSGAYRPGLAEAVYWTAPFVASWSVRLVIAAAGLGQLAGAALFVVNMWSRVRMPTAAGPSAR